MSWELVTTYYGIAGCVHTSVGIGIGIGIWADAGYELGLNAKNHAVRKNHRYIYE